MGTPINVPMDVPDADAAEQARELRAEEVTSTVGQLGPVLTSSEVDEFDAVEQHIEIAADDDEYR